MSQEITLVASLTVVPDKIERFREICGQAAKTLQDLEPDALEFRLCEGQRGEDGIQCMMIERYASQAALDHHRSTDHYKEIMGSIGQENLLTGPPTMSEAKHVSGFSK